MDIGEGLTHSYAMSGSSAIRSKQIPSLPPLNVQNLLRQHGLRPHKGLGQNFLQDDHMLRKIIALAEIEPGDTILEVGAGLGSLTRYLALVARQVVAVELDRNLFKILESICSPYRNIHLISGDILELPLPELITSEDFKVVANIPYYITSALLRRLLESEPRPHRLVLTVQKEVARRICARPGDMSLLALSVQVYGEPQIKMAIPASAFYPAPKVDSAVVCVDVHPEPAIPAGLLDTFFTLAKDGFRQKRKMLHNALASRLPRNDTTRYLEAAGIDSNRRAESLSIQEWGKLTEVFASLRKM